jgi:O-antigen/teichoic acid export membrane protein
MMFYIVLFGTAVATMVYPMMSRAFADSDLERGHLQAHRLLSLAFYYELIIAIPVAVFILALAPLAFAVLLPGFTDAAPIAQALAFAGVLLALELPAVSILPAANRPDLLLRLLIVQATTAVALNVLLVPQIGAPWGGVWGAVLSDWGAAFVGLAYSYALVRSIGIRFPSYQTFRSAVGEHLVTAAPPRT